MVFFRIYLNVTSIVRLYYFSTILCPGGAGNGAENYSNFGGINTGIPDAPPERISGFELGRATADSEPAACKEKSAREEPTS